MAVSIASPVFAPLPEVFYCHRHKTVEVAPSSTTASVQPSTSSSSSSFSSSSSSYCSSTSCVVAAASFSCRGFHLGRPIGQVHRLETNGSFVGRNIGHGWQSRVFQRRERVRRCALADGNGTGNGNGSPAGDGPPGADRGILNRRREMLQEYVKSVQPDFMEKFLKRAPEQVVEAMRQTVTNMLGTLPPHFFEIRVSTVAENLAQLMYSVMMTGYMFRNAQFRLDLQQSLSQVALREPDTKQDPDYEPSVNKSKVSGEVLRWHKEDGIEQVPAVEYIEMLESEIRELQQQLESQQRASRGRNELLQYLKSLEPQNLQELTTTAGEDTVEAMNTFITRLLGVKDPAQLKRAATETSAAELAQLLYWLMVVGYSIRNIEVRFDMERILGEPVSSRKLPGLPPGENI
ncbi:unnamed protein product [Calypogeia fissa]